jgi:hypothetical protein
MKNQMIIIWKKNMTKYQKKNKIKAKFIIKKYKSNKTYKYWNWWWIT